MIKVKMGVTKWVTEWVGRKIKNMIAEILKHKFGILSFS